MKRYGIRILLCVFPAIGAHGDHHDHGGAILNADQEITDHDLEHLKEIHRAKKPIKELTKEERLFYAFKHADYDNNDMLEQV